MKLRYPGVCRRCGASLPAGQLAVYVRSTRQVQCLDCGPGAAPPPDAVFETGPVDGGKAGASARREHQRRVAKREERVRSAHPRLGGVILALTDEPQSTRAWQRGAVGEEKLARSLDALVERGARTLHDRRIPRSRANIDHLLVAPAGVFVIDAKRYVGRPELKVEGGILRPRTETLLVGRRDRTKLVEGVHKQVDVVRALLDLQTETRGMLCFVDADWPLFGGHFTIDGVEVLWPNKIAERAFATRALGAESIETVHRVLAAALPSAVPGDKF